MDFGYINTEKIEIKVKTEHGEKVCKVPLLKSIDGFTILKSCPLSMGRFDEEKLNNMDEAEEIQIRKTEHQIMKKLLMDYFPEDWEVILDRMPYFDFLAMLNVLMSGEKDRTEDEVIADYGKNSPQHLLWIATHPFAKDEKERKTTEKK